MDNAKAQFVSIVKYIEACDWDNSLCHTHKRPILRTVMDSHGYVGQGLATEYFISENSPIGPPQTGINVITDKPIIVRADVEINQKDNGDYVEIANTLEKNLLTSINSYEMELIEPLRFFLRERIALTEKLQQIRKRIQ